MSVLKLLTRAWNTPLGVALLYASFAGLWIILSGYLLAITVADPLLQSRIELAKGLVFVAVTASLLYLLLKRWQESAGGAIPSATSIPPKTLALLLTLILLVLVVPLMDMTIYELHVPQTEHDAFENLSAIAELKSGQIENWLKERQGDAQGLADNPDFALHVGDMLDRTSGAKERKEVLAELESLRANHGFDSILIIDAGGRLLTSIGNDTDNPPQNLLRQALSGGRVVFSDLYRDDAGNINLDWMVPIAAGELNQRAVAVAVLRVVPDKFLYKLIQTWPTRSDSGETLLVRSDGDDVLFLNTLRFDQHAALTLHDTLNNPDLPAAIAIHKNKPGTMAGLDYRKVPVLAAYWPVEGTTWNLIAKLDRSEVLSPLRILLYWVSGVGTVAVFMIMALLTMLLRQQQRAQQLALQARSAEILKESGLRFRTLVGTIPDLVWLKDKDGIYLNCNKQFERLYGAMETDIIGKSDYDFVDKELADSFREHDRKAMASGKSMINEEWLTFAEDGYRGLFETIKTPMKDANGNLIGVLGVSRDISERKRAEESLLKLSQAVEQSPSSIVITDLDAHIEYANAAFARESGYSLEEAIGKNPKLLHSGKTPKSTYDDMWAHLKRGEIWKGEFINRRKDGSEYVESAIISPVFQPDGRKTHYLAVKDNITEQKQTVQRLAESEKHFRSLFENMLEGYAYCKMTYVQGVPEDWVYLSVNRAFETLTGLSGVIGRNVTEVIPGIRESNPELFDLFGRVAMSGRPEQVETYVEGLGIWFSISVYSPMREYFVAVFDNITKRMTNEAKILRLTKLYASLSQCNEAIVRCTSAEELLPVICRDAVQYGGMNMAWIGMVDEASKRVVPVASYGDGKEYLDGIQISVDANDPFGRGPTGTAIRENRPYWCQDYQHDPSLAPWRKPDFDWKSSAALPLLKNGIPVGNLTLYSDTINAFDEEARRLLTEMTLDISFALDNFEREAERKQAAQELADSEQRFRGLVEQSVAGVLIIQDNKLVYVNPRCAEIIGQGSAEDLIGRDPLHFVAETDRGKVTEAMHKLFEKVQHSIVLDFSVIHKDGATVTVGANANLAIYHGRPAIIGLIQDISVKKRDEERILNYVDQLKATFLSTVQLATSLSEMRDPYTAGHERRVSEIAVAIATEMGLDEQRLEGIKVAGFLHDIGKISIPAEILVKPGRLTATEYALVQGHAQASYDVLKHVEFPWPVATVALQHHERMDGSGYPNGLKGDEILLESRIMAVADVVEAMASHRPYRPGLGIDKALAEIERGRGTAYDPVVVDTCLSMFREKRFELPPH